MSMFKCETCKAVDVFEIAYADLDLNNKPKKLECTECRTGKWHNLFPKVTYESDVHTIINDDEVISPSLD